MFKYVKNHKVIASYNSVVKKGPEAINKYVYAKEEWKLCPVHLQQKAVGKLAAVKIAKRLGSAVAKKVPIIGIGLTIILAERMHADGYPAAVIEMAVLDDLFNNVPGMAVALTNGLLNEAE